MQEAICIHGSPFSAQLVPQQIISTGMWLALLLFCLVATYGEPDSAAPPDFSKPWKCSDVVLVVEDQKFHVHRYTLAMWSPDFEKMFTSQFKERNSFEIPPPGKKASEIKELLLIIYLNISGKAWNTVTNENCYFLVKLADEYQMEEIFKRCQDVLVKLISAKPGNTFLDDLTLHRPTS